MTTQCPPHETVYMGRCMCCLQKVSRKPRRLVAYGILVRGCEPVVWVDPDWQREIDYDLTIASFEQMTGRY